MVSTIRIPKPRDPLSGMIANYRGAYARKWRVPVSEASQTEEARPGASMAEPDAFIAKIRGILFGREQ